MRQRRMKVGGRDAVYHCMTRTVNGERLFGDREKEILRKMITQVADFCGVELLTYCIMSNHFHVLVNVPQGDIISDQELMRRYRVLYPKPTKYQAASADLMEKTLFEGSEEAVAIRRRLLLRMGDVSEFMKTLKQRFTTWFNKSQKRYGPLWSDRFKSVLVEGEGNPLQTMAAYIDLNPVRAGIAGDPKDYRFCGYAEAVAGRAQWQKGLLRIWGAYLSRRADVSQAKLLEEALKAHRMLLFGKASSPLTHRGVAISREQAVKVLEDEGGALSRTSMLHCRVRYFSDGAILGSAEFVRGFVESWQVNRNRKHPPKVNPLKGDDWGDLAVIQSIRRRCFG